MSVALLLLPVVALIGMLWASKAMGAFERGVSRSVIAVRSLAGLLGAAAFGWLVWETYISYQIVLEMDPRAETMAVSWSTRDMVRGFALYSIPWAVMLGVSRKLSNQHDSRR